MTVVDEDAALSASPQRKPYPGAGETAGNTDRRAVSFTLYDHKGNAVVLVEATNHDTGERYRGELTKVAGPAQVQGGGRKDRP